MSAPPISFESESERVLYDTDWIDAGCPPSQYDPDTNVDSSVWTFTTSYAIAAMGITLAILLLAISSTSPSSLPSSTQQSSAAARRKLSKEEKKNQQQQQDDEDDHRPQHSQLNSSLEQQSVPHTQGHSRSLADEPSMKSWQSYEESLVSAVYLEDGTISTNPKDSADKEATTNVVVTHAPQQAPTHISLGSAPPELFQVPPTEANSDPDSDNSTLTTVEGGSKEAEPNLYDDYYMTLLVCYFVFQSISYLVAGFGHMASQDFSGKMPNRIVHGTASFAACSLFAVAASEYLRLLFPQKQQQQTHESTNVNNNSRSSLDEPTGAPQETGSRSSNSSNGNKTIAWTATWMFCSLPAVVVFVILDSDLYTQVFVGASHFAVLLTAFFRICFSDRRVFLMWYILDVMAMLIYLVGLFVQLYLEGPCGHDGYKDDCFADCPLPTSPSSLNHNALFHLCVLLALLLYGCSKMVQMQPPKQTSVFRLRGGGGVGGGSANSSTQPSSPGHRGRTSGAAAAVLMQDHTAEV